MGLEELIQEVRNILSMDFELPSESLYIGFIKNSSFEVCIGYTQWKVYEWKTGSVFQRPPESNQHDTG